MRALGLKVLKKIREAARARRQWEQENIYYTKSEAERRHAWALIRMRDV